MSKAPTFTYYPGCSLHSTGVEFDASTAATFSALNVTLHELEDWNCCGASSAHSVNHTLALALPARNLARAQTAGYDMVMPCAACFNRHQTVAHTMRHDPAQRRTLEEIVDFSFDDSVAVRPLLDVVGKEVPFTAVQERVRRPLQELQVVAYYGCLLVRPPDVTQFENPEHPTRMDDLLTTLGAQPHDWSYSTVCCGGALALTSPAVAARLVNRLAGWAREAGAEAIVTSCPLCQVNLEMRQEGNGQRLPIFYFTELMGLAFGLEEAARWWGKHLIDPRPLLRSRGLDQPI